MVLVAILGFLFFRKYILLLDILYLRNIYRTTVYLTVFNCFPYYLRIIAIPVLSTNKQQITANLDLPSTVQENQRWGEPRKFFCIGNQMYIPAR